MNVRNIANNKTFEQCGIEPTNAGLQLNGFYFSVFWVNIVMNMSLCFHSKAFN